MVRQSSLPTLPSDLERRAQEAHDAGVRRLVELLREERVRLLERKRLLESQLGAHAQMPSDFTDHELTEPEGSLMSPMGVLSRHLRKIF